MVEKKKRRGRGEGSIRKRPDGRFEARLRVDGRRRTVYGKTRQEAARALRGLQEARDKALPVPDGRETVETFLMDWLASEANRLRPTTHARYETLMRLHVIPALGTVRLVKMTPHEVQRLYDERRNSGLSPTTVHHIHAVLHKALEQAMRWGKVFRNVCDLVDAPPIRRADIRTLSADEARRFLACARDDRFDTLYIIALTTGMRQGELLALRWRDVNIDKGTLQVRGTLHWTKGGGFRVDEPKTKSSRRLIQLTQDAVEALDRQRIRQTGERLLSGEFWQEHGFVFANHVGRPTDPDNLVRRSFKPLLKRAEVSDIRFHDLRHTAATLLLEQGVHVKYVSEMLGHSSIAITLDLYSHVTPTMHHEAKRTMERIFSAGGGGD